MSAPVLATKLYIPPPRPNAVLRPHLIERMNEALRRTPGVTLLSAPAGFGKTMLVGEWAAGCERLEPPVRTAWLSLDDADNDPARFLAYVIAALQTIEAAIGEGASRMLQVPGPQPLPVEAVLTALLNDIAALPGRVALVLDDYHVIDAPPTGTSTDVDDALAFLIEHLPPQLHLVIATREDPDLPLARLRARGQLTELRAADLRFTLSEAAGFLNRVMGLSLSADDVAALEARTEGWIAGLQLAAISMQGRKDAAGFIKSFTGSHHFVMDYLVEEVLQQQPGHVQRFLLHTSILDRMCGPLCDAVLLDPAARGQDTLVYLERANLLVVPLDDRREWYRYHHLFAEVLQARLIKTQPGQAADLHRRASAWWAQNDFRADAIRHALAARDFERAADLIEMERSVNAGRYFQSATWRGWVKALPEGLVRTRPRLSIGYVWELLFSGEMEAAQARMLDVERLLESAVSQDPPQAPTTRLAAAPRANLRPLQVSLAIARAFHAQALGDAAGTVGHARRALALIPEADGVDRGLAGSLLGLASLTDGDLETAHQYIIDAVTRMRAAGNLLFATSGTYVLADIRVEQGRLLDAIRTYEQALQLVSVPGEPVLQGTADLYLGLSELSRERGNVEAAEQHLLKSEALGKPAALDGWPYRLYLARARLKEDQGDLDGALQMLDEAERLHHRSPVPNLRPISALRARVWLRQGRLAEALDWVRQQHLSVDDDLSYRREFEHITLARVLIARYQSERADRSIDEAVGLLERLLKAAEEGGRMGSVIELLALQALAHQAAGSFPRALAPLERALTLAAPEGYVRVFVDEGRPMAALLAALSASGEGERPAPGQAVGSYSRQLLAAFEPRAAQPSAPVSRPLIEPLSRRELEILQLIAEGLSNHEIGERLFLAVNTVKGYNLKIFGKLQVQRRTEAVARARELGLLKPDR